ncbi:MAG TPA: chaperone modulator CbpM [Gammaproteobacteria bacterium]|nr:chaperone modulator CbpM [Gammaproteobacteria bacterium]
MTTKETLSLIYGELLDEEGALTLGELCRVCEVSAERVRELVDEGVLEPEGREITQWRFRAISIRRARSALRLERDLGVNAAGAALVLDLLEELETLRARLRRFEE